MEDQTTTTTETTQTTALPELETTGGEPTFDQAATFAEAAEASAKAEHEAKYPPRAFKEMLPVALTEHELASIAKRAAAARSLVSEHEAGKKAAMDEWKEAISEAENERDSLLDAIAKGSEERLVECIEVREFRTGVVTVTRGDTGEKIRERAMTSNERQMTIAGTDAAPSSSDVADTGDAEANDSADIVAAVTAAEEIDLPDFGAESDVDGNVIEDPQAVLDGATQEEATKKRKRRAKKNGGAS